jgi:hypothetical protein
MDQAGFPARKDPWGGSDDSAMERILCRDSAQFIWWTGEAWIFISLRFK